MFKCKEQLTAAQQQDRFENRHFRHQEALLLNLSLASHALARLEAKSGENVPFTVPDVRGLNFIGPMKLCSMSSLMQHLAQPVPGVPNVAEAPPDSPAGPPPPVRLLCQGSPWSLCDPRRVAGAGGPRGIGPYRALCCGAGGDGQFQCLPYVALPGVASTPQTETRLVLLLLSLPDVLLIPSWNTLVTTCSL